MKGSKNPFNLIRSFNYRLKNKIIEFPHFGLHLFIGAFGSGKTMSSVDLITNILELYPKCELVSNVSINNIKNNNYCDFESYHVFLYQWAKCVTRDNFQDGTIVLVDEVQTYFRELLEQHGSNKEFDLFFTILGQLRKLNCFVIFTSQLYNKVQKILRDYILQNGQIVQCKKLFNGFTFYRYFDMSTIEETSKIILKGKYKRYDYIIHTPELYTSYNSRAIVASVSGLLNEVNKNDRDK